MTAPLEPTLMIPRSISRPPSSSKSSGSSRIPESLKIIFIQAAHDQEILDAPTDGSAFKTFERPGIDRPYIRPNEKVTPAKDTREVRSQRAQGKNTEPNEALAERPERSSRSKLERAERPKLGRSDGLRPADETRSPELPERPKLGKSDGLRPVDGTRTPKVSEVGAGRAARRTSAFGNLLGRSGHGDERPTGFGGFLNRSGHGERSLKREEKKKENKSKDELSAKGSSHMSSIFDRQRRKRSQELGVLPTETGEAGSPIKPIEGMATPKEESSTPAPPSRGLLKASKSDDLSSMRQLKVTDEKKEEKEDEDDGLDNSSGHLKKALGGLAAYPSQRSPQVFLDVMLRTRGYPTETYSTLQTSYYNAPTELQTSSYNVRMQELIRLQNEKKLREIMTCGISTNPCNSYGESLLHTACRNGYDTSVRVMLECGASVQVSDDCGRTPLHSAFFGTTPSYDIVEMIVCRDRHLLHLKDRHGATPLSYIPRDHWGMWIDFFYSRRDSFWPRRNKRFDGVAESSPKLFEKPNSAPLPAPSNALTPEMASMVASGKLSPEEAQYLMNGDDDDDDTEFDATSCSGSVYTESFGSYYSMGASGHSAPDNWFDSNTAHSQELEVRKDTGHSVDVGDLDDFDDDNMSAATDISGDSFA